MNAPKFAALMAGLAAAALVAAPAQARVYEGGITHAEMQKLLVDAGFNTLAVEEEDAKPDAVPDLVIMGGPARWYVEFMACKEGRCADLHLHAGFNVEGAVSEAIVTEMNQALLGKLSGNVYIDDEQDPILQADVNTDGVTGNNIRYSMRVFDTVVRCLTVKIGFDATAGACDDLEGRLVGLASQGIAADDVQHVIAAITPADLERILREAGYTPVAEKEDSGLASFSVTQDGVRWVAAIPAARSEQINAPVFLVTGCGKCKKDTFRRANAYNAARRWVSAEGQDQVITGTTTIPLSGGITEAALGMMFRSFHSWAVTFEKDIPE